MVAERVSAWKKMAAGPFSHRGGATFLGLSVSRAWTYAFFISLLRKVETPFPALPATDTLFFLTATAIALIVAAAAPRVERVFAQWAPWVVSIVGTASALCVIACNAFGGNALTCICVVLGGTTLALFRLSWGQLYARLGQKEIGICTAFSFLIATSVNVLLKLLPWPCTVVALVALPTLGGLLAHRAWHTGEPEFGHGPARSNLDTRECDTPSTTRSKGASPVTIAQLALGMFVFVFANSIVRMLVVNGEEQIWVSGWGAHAVDAVVALLFVGLYVTIRDMNPLPAYRCTLILMVAGYTLCTLVPEERQPVIMSLVLVGYGLFDLLSWTVMARVASQVKTSSLRVFGLGIGATVTGRALGYVVGAACAAQQTAGNLSLQSLSMLMVFLLVIACASILPESVFGHAARADGPEGTADGIASPGADATSFETACATVARTGSLTARETDVLVPLARGHSAQVISNELSITKGTVQTHIKHIYTKLGLHGQQELIELVESLCTQTGKTEKPR